MCIKNHEGELQKVRSKGGELKLWKVVRRDNKIGLWTGTGWRNPDAEEYLLGLNTAKDSQVGYQYPTRRQGQFHCFFTRKEARAYMNYRYKSCSVFKLDKSKYTKIVRVCAKSSAVVMVGKDYDTGIRAISVSKMEIKSLKHQR